MLKKISTLKNTHSVGSWPAVICEKGFVNFQGRICAIRKSEEAIDLAHKKLKRSSSKRGHKVQPDTFEYAKYVILFTIFPEDDFSAEEVLEWYRLRWQVELVFKRFKSLVALGHLPKYDDESSKAWLYGKLLVALLSEKLADYARFFPPGDTSWSKKQPKSAWREFSFLLHQIQRAVEPELSLHEVIGDWNHIAQALAEKSRISMPQLLKHFDC